MKNKKNPVILHESDIDSTLVDLNSLALAIPQSQEIEEKVQLMNEIESTSEILKQNLSIKRQQIELEVENTKLDTGKKVMDAALKLTDKVLNEYDNVKIKTALDLKLTAEAIERLTNANKSLMNPNTLDAEGNKKRHKINFMFKSNGPIQAAIQIDNSDE